MVRRRDSVFVVSYVVSALIQQWNRYDAETGPVKPNCPLILAVCAIIVALVLAADWLLLSGLLTR
jgi:hypothetical protein